MRTIMRLLFPCIVLWSASWLCAQPPDLNNAQIHVLPVRGNVYMLIGAGVNATVQVGKQGVLIVDTMFAPLAPKMMAEIRKLSNGPIRYIINTHAHPDHTGGNAAIYTLAAPDAAQPLNVIAHENVLARMTTPVTGSQTPPTEPGLPSDEYFRSPKNMHFNGEAIILYHEEKAHTDGDTVVLFRGSDVLVAGDIFTPEHYPFIDLAHGGSVEGEIAALNHILELTVPEDKEEGGTLVIPGHGRLCDQIDVVEYRDMIVIVRDRIQDAMKKGKNLEQIQAARPTLDYDTRYISKDPGVKAGAFVETVYKSLGGK